MAYFVKQKTCNTNAAQEHSSRKPVLQKPRRVPELGLGSRQKKICQDQEHDAVQTIMRAGRVELSFSVLLSRLANKYGVLRLWVLNADSAREAAANAPLWLLVAFKSLASRPDTQRLRM